MLVQTMLPGGRSVLILALTGPPPRLRIPAPRPEPSALPPVAPPPALALPEIPTDAAPPRFIWRSGPDDILDQVSGPAGAFVRDAMIGRSWADLSEAGTLVDADGLLAALAGRRTFRAVPLTLRRPGPAGHIDLELSGAPLSRADRGFSGYGGFGLVRPSASIAPASPETSGTLPDPDLSDAPVAATPPHASETEASTRIDAAVPSVLAPVARFGLPWLGFGAFAAIQTIASAGPPHGKRTDTSLPPGRSHADAPASAALDAEPQVPPGDGEESFEARASDAAPTESDTIARADAVGSDHPRLPPDEGSAEAEPGSIDDLPREPVGLAEAPPDEDEPAPAVPVDTRLSGNEHAAFREIARALGARFAGDEDAPVAERGADGDSRPLFGAIMPFPSAALRQAEAVAPRGEAVTATLESLPTGVLIYRDGTVLFANRSLLDLARFPEVADLEAAGGLARLFAGSAPHDRDAGEALAILTTREGATLHVDLQSSEFAWEGGPARLLLVREATWTGPAEQLAAAQVAKDFADRRSADALAALDALDDGIVTLDGNGRILSLNRNAAARFGVEPREVVGGGFLDLFAPDSAVAVLAILHGMPGASDGAVTGRGPDGPIPLRLTISPLRGGEDPTVLALIRDAAPAVADAQAGAAEIASAQKSDFLAQVSHEIRTPISSILGFADVMLMGQFGPVENERYRGYLHDIRASGEHVLSLVNDLLDLAKIEAGRLDLDLVEVPLNEVVSSCVALMQPQAARERILIRTSFSNDLTPFVADARSVRQAALNVIANAIRFTEAGGQVIVSTTMADRGEVALRVRDTGIGMTPDEVETALEPFRQLSGREGGTGLGLPLTKALVEANRGRFRITSRKDEGTLVEMLFPTDRAMRA
ncbi:MAG TPA: ATP-binding protein [Methylobacterium sp.]|jgi:PAS domain S-box-containing protein